MEKIYWLFIISSLFISLKYFFIESCTGAVCERFPINSSFSKISAIILSSVCVSFLTEKLIMLDKKIK